jgi:hypothetical protein
MVQEQVLNQRIAILRGQRLLPWEIFATIPSLRYANSIIPSIYYVYYMFKASESLNAYKKATVLSRLMGMRRVRTQDVGALRNPSLLQNLATLGSLECRDQRDSIYALLSISKESDELDIRPDYSEDNSAIDLFCSASVKMLHYYHDLRALAIACLWTDSFSEGFPSWAIKFPRQVPTELASDFAEYSPHSSDESQSPLFSNVCASDRCNLVLTGRIIDSIASHATPAIISSSFLHGIRDKSCSITATQVLSKWIDVLLQTGVTLDSTAILSSAILSHQSSWAIPDKNSHATKEKLTFLYLWYCRFLARGVLDRSSSNDAKTELKEVIINTLQSVSSLVMKEPLEQIPLSEPFSDEDQKYGREFLESSRFFGRSFSVTKAGRVCNAMHEVKPGDAIVAFQNAERLYVIRPVGDKYRLVGDAMVPGLMFGEAYENLDPNEVDYMIELI